MPIRFAQPLALILLLLLPALWLIPRGRRSAMRLRRERASIAIRILLTLLVVLSLAGLQSVWADDRLAVVFLLDLSDSVGAEQQERALAFLEAARAEMRPSDRAGLVVFGREALVEERISPGEPLQAWDAIASIPRTDGTDIASAVRLGLALFPETTQRRLLLLSDGVETLGDSAGAVQLARAYGAYLDVMPVGGQPGPELVLESLEVPSQLYTSERFDLVVRVRASIATLARLQVFADGELAAQQDVDLRVGDNAFALSLAAGEPGFHRYQAYVVPLDRAGPSDTFYQNNNLGAYSLVRGEPRLWLVSRDPAESANLRAALEAAGFGVDETAPAYLPSDLAGLASYHAVVLVNIPARTLTDRQMAALQVYVRDLGRGLVVIGGEESYGVGGYFRTPLEETLPVNMALQDQERRPSLALLFVIDKSGSMASPGSPGAQPKIELAKEAIARAVELLGPVDRVGVIAFDNMAGWVAELVELEDGDLLLEAVGSLRASGGTDIYAGVHLAAEAMAGESARLRHVILLSDGGANPQGIQEMVQIMHDGGTTLSAVAIGQGYAPFLADLAETGGGRFHVTADAEAIPQIFAEEAALATRAYIIEETFTPRPSVGSSILTGLSTLPPIHGYVGTSLKSTARAALTTAQGDPLLASWQYGLGRAVAWTSDAKGRWAVDWVRWPGFADFWAQAVRWTIVEVGERGLELSVQHEGEQARLVADLLAADGAYLDGFEVAATVIGPAFVTRTLALRQTAPGRYESAYEPEAEGVYMLQVGAQGEGMGFVGSTGFIRPYAAEYRSSGPDLDALAQLADVGGGQLVTDPLAVFRHDLPPVRAARDLWPWLLTLAAILLPLDVGIRRVTMTRRELRQLWHRLAAPVARLQQRAAPAEREARVERLIRARGRAQRAREAERPPALAPEAMVDPLLREEREKPEALPSPSRRAEAHAEEEPAPEEMTARLLRAKRQARGEQRD
jgi:uncharacterized membrane protein